jgi:Ca2+-binding RTX toxin-like protein
LKNNYHNLSYSLSIFRVRVGIVMVIAAVLLSSATVWLTSYTAILPGAFATTDPPPPPPLTAEIAASPTQGDAPLTVTFQAITTGGIPPHEYFWDFNSDGNFDVNTLQPIVQHTFNEPGIYLVKLVVVDEVVAGPDLVATDILEITVNEPPPACEGETATIVGTEGNDNNIFGTSSRDIIAGLGGNDRIAGLAGNDLICGDEGNDRIEGGTGDDNLIGGSNDDMVRGGSGNDRLAGESGNDDLQGESGNDLLDGGPDTDNGNGGDGTDTCDAEIETNCEA